MLCVTHEKSVNTHINIRLLLLLPIPMPSRIRGNAHTNVIFVISTPEKNRLDISKSSYSSYDRIINRIDKPWYMKRNDYSFLRTCFFIFNFNQIIQLWRKRKFWYGYDVAFIYFSLLFFDQLMRCHILLHWNGPSHPFQYT